MNNFTWGCPTRFVFGKDVLDQLGSALKDDDAQRVLVVYGGSFAKKSGLVDRVQASLEEAGMSTALLGGVRSNPEVAKVREGVQAARDFAADYVLAIGGGSVIDCAKAVAFSANYEGDPWDFFCGKARIAECLPIACVLTIPAAGSESSNSCVISNDAINAKRGANSELFRPRMAFMDPQLTYSLPNYQTAAGATDMIAHICERWFSGVPAVPVTDRTAAGLIRTIMEVAPICLQTPDDYEARANLMWAGTLAHNGIAGVGRSLVAESRAGGWESHALEHELSALKTNVTHGAGLAVILPAWMRHVWKADPSRFVDFAREVFGDEPDNATPEAQEALVTATIDKLQAFFASLGMPTTLGELGIGEGDIDQLLIQLEATKGAAFGAFMRLTMDDAREIYTSAL